MTTVMQHDNTIPLAKKRTHLYVLQKLKKIFLFVELAKFTSFRILYNNLMSAVNPQCIRLVCFLVQTGKGAPMFYYGI